MSAVAFPFLPFLAVRPTLCTKSEELSAPPKSSSNTIAGAWGDTLEMHLLSHARDGEVAFRIIDFARRRTAFCCSLPMGRSYHPH